MAREIKYIAIHCTAGARTATREEVMRVFATRGWKRPGYHYLITADGTIHQLVEEDKISNGVKGYNRETINVAYTGGVDISKAGLPPVDNRTPAQREALKRLIRLLKQRYPTATVQGHRDFPGVAKACPSFDAKQEYQTIHYA